MRDVPYQAERDALLEDLRAAFEPGLFERAYGATPPMAVSVGGDSQEPPFEVIVWPLPQSVSNVHRTAGPCQVISTSFELAVGLVASGATEADASHVALCYLDCVHQACMADPTLRGLVDRAEPTLSQGGVGADSGSGYTCGLNVRISCSRDIPVNNVIARIVRRAAELVRRAVRAACGDS